MIMPGVRSMVRATAAPASLRIRWEQGRPYGCGRHGTGRGHHGTARTTSPFVGVVRGSGPDRSRRGTRWQTPDVFLAPMPTCGNGNCTRRVAGWPAPTSSTPRVSADRRGLVVRRRRRPSVPVVRRCSRAGGTRCRYTSRTASGAACPRVSASRCSPPCTDPAPAPPGAPGTGGRMARSVEGRWRRAQPDVGPRGTMPVLMAAERTVHAESSHERRQRVGLSLAQATSGNDGHAPNPTVTGSWLTVPRSGLSASASSPSDEGRPAPV